MPRFYILRQLYQVYYQLMGHLDQSETFYKSDQVINLPLILYLSSKYAYFRF